MKIILHYIKALPAILQQYGYRLIDKAIEGFALDIFVSLMRREKDLNWKKMPEIMRLGHV